MKIKKITNSIQSAHDNSTILIIVRIIEYFTYIIILIARLTSKYNKLINYYVRNAGKKSFIWNGPIPNINIADPKMIREILFKHEIFQKPKSNSVVKLFVSGMVAYEGEQWFKVRKIANPAFHQHKLKVHFIPIHLSHINSSTDSLYVY